MLSACHGSLRSFKEFKELFKLHKEKLINYHNYHNIDLVRSNSRIHSWDIFQCWCQFTRIVSSTKFCEGFLGKVVCSEGISVTNFEVTTTNLYLCEIASMACHFLAWHSIAWYNGSAWHGPTSRRSDVTMS